MGITTRRTIFSYHFSHHGISDLKIQEFTHKTEYNFTHSVKLSFDHPPYTRNTSKTISSYSSSFAIDNQSASVLTLTSDDTFNDPRSNCRRPFFGRWRNPKSFYVIFDVDDNVFQFARRTVLTHMWLLWMSFLRSYSAIFFERIRKEVTVYLPSNSSVATW